MKYVTGIGSRSVPKDIYDQLYRRALRLADDGYTLRSGGADGCDQAFEYAFTISNSPTEIYLPWKNFNNNNSPLYNSLPEAFEIAAKIHPAWNSLKDAVKHLHARNIHQVLGQDLKTPSDLLVCWTPNGEVIGGTATALKLATQYEIEIINYGTP